MLKTEREKALDFLNGRMKPIAGLGIPAYDEQYLLKRGEWTLVGGHPSSGKSTLEMYTMFLHSIKFGTRWVCLMMENEIWNNIVFLTLWQHGYSQETISQFVPEHKQILAMDWIEHHFKFMSMTKTWNAYDALAEAEYHITEEGYHGFLIDPYNGLIRQGKGASNTHDYDYEVAAEFRAFTKRLNCYLITVAHPQTEAQRATHKDGDTFQIFPLSSRMIKMPNRTDFEGGSKWANRADNIKIWHRYINHPDLWNYNILSVAKIKQSLTGGRPTRDEDDMILFKAEGRLSRFSVNGANCLDQARGKETAPPPPLQPTPEIEDVFSLEPQNEIPF